MRTKFGRIVVIALAFAAMSLAQGGDKGAGPQKADPRGPLATPELPTGTLPLVALPSDPRGSAPVHLAARDDDKDTSIRVPGTIRPASEANVNPLVSGQVTVVLVREGEAVKAGQALARLDRREYELKLKRADARLERAKAALKQAEATHALRQAEVETAEAAIKQAEAKRNAAKKKLERMRDLLQRQAIDERLVDETEAQFQAAEAQVEQAKAALRVAQGAAEGAGIAAAKADIGIAEAERELAKMDVDATEIRAPVAGTVLARHIKVGDGVGPAQASGRPTPLFELADLTQLDAVANVAEKDLAALKVGQKCEVRVDAAPGAVYAGKVSRIAPIVARQDRTVAVRVKIDLPKDGQLLSPGMYGVVRILGKD